MTESTWNEDTTQSDKSGATSAPANSASTGGIEDGGGGNAGTRSGDAASGGTSGTTTGDAPYDLDPEGEAGADAQSPSGT